MPHQGLVGHASLEVKWVEDQDSVGTLTQRGMKITALNPGEQQKVVASLKPVYDKYAEALGKELVEKLLAAVK